MDLLTLEGDTPTHYARVLMKHIFSDEEMACSYSGSFVEIVDRLSSPITSVLPTFCFHFNSICSVAQWTKC